MTSVSFRGVTPRPTGGTEGRTPRGGVPVARVPRQPVPPGAGSGGERRRARRRGVPVPPMAPWHLAPPPADPGGERRRARRRAAEGSPGRAFRAASGSPSGLLSRGSVGVVVRAAAGSSSRVPSPDRPPGRARGPRPGRPLRHRADGELTAALRRPVTRLYLALAATWLAFGAGLASLAGGLRFSSTTGELIVVPVVVTVLLHVMIARHQGLWNGRLGHGDYVAVLAAVVLAGGVAWWRPAAELNEAALKRLDLLVLPLVLAAVLVLVLGLRVLVVGAFPLLFAFLTWPYPWTLVETHTISGLARVTYTASAWLTDTAGVAEPVRGADAVLRVGDGAAAFEISVAPACSGFTGIVAYLLLGGGTLFLLRGHAVRKAAWLVAGLLAVWVATLTRILLLATAGDLWGDGAALQVLHPYAGLTLDALVFVLMLRLAGRFGLSPARSRPVTPGVQTDAADDDPAARGLAGPRPARRWCSWWRRPCRCSARPVRSGCRRGRSRTASTGRRRSRSSEARTPTRRSSGASPGHARSSAVTRRGTGTSCGGTFPAGTGRACGWTRSP